MAHFRFYCHFHLIWKNWIQLYLLPPGFWWNYATVYGRPLGIFYANEKYRLYKTAFIQYGIAILSCIFFIGGACSQRWEPQRWTVMKSQANYWIFFKELNSSNEKFEKLTHFKFIQYKLFHVFVDIKFYLFLGRGLTYLCYLFQIFNTVEALEQYTRKE